jgi:hypothetical protein
MAHKDTYPYKGNDSETMSLIVAPTAPKLADYMRPVRKKLQGSNQLAKPVKANEGLSEPESKPGQSAIAAEFQSKLLNCTRSRKKMQIKTCKQATSSMPDKKSYCCFPSSIPSNLDEALAQPWTLQDLGGNGDCNEAGSDLWQFDKLC